MFEQCIGVLGMRDHDLELVNLSQVNRDAWHLLGNQWNRWRLAASRLGPLFLSSLMQPRKLEFSAALLYKRKVVGEITLPVDPHSRPMEIYRIEISCSAPCEISWLFWEYPLRTWVDKQIVLEFPRSVHSANVDPTNYLGAKDLCIIRSDDCLIECKIYATDGWQAWNVLWYRELCHSQLLGEPSKRERAFWNC